MDVFGGRCVDSLISLSWPSLENSVKIYSNLSAEKFTSTKFEGGCSVRFTMMEPKQKLLVVDSECEAIRPQHLSLVRMRRALRLMKVQVMTGLGVLATHFLFGHARSFAMGRGVVSEVWENAGKTKFKHVRVSSIW